MSFFNYKPQTENPQVSKPEVKVDPHTVIIDGSNLIKVVEDNPELPELPVDIGMGLQGIWQPCNYDHTTGKVRE
jgi:hypothetical protein